jgi:hypothetical protein
MSCIPFVVGGAADLPGADVPAAGEPRMVERNERLSEPLLVISLALRSVAAAKEQFPDYRLTRLVSARLELDEPDVAQLPDLLRPARDALRPFDHHLRHVIVRYGWKPSSATTSMGRITMRSVRPATISIATKSFQPVWKSGGPTIAACRMSCECSPPRSSGSAVLAKATCGFGGFPVHGTQATRSRA